MNWLALVGAFALVMPFAVTGLTVWYLERRHDREITRLREAHERDLARLHEMYTTAAQRIGNIAQFGQAERVEAVVEEREPDAATRVARRVTEETLDRAVNALRDEYAKIGLPMGDDELRTEAMSIMLGNSVPLPPVLRTFLRD